MLLRPIAPGGRWVWVNLPWATFALQILDGKVAQAPPIARWTVGKPEKQVADYYRARGARFLEIE